jgi:hypothetical protein
MDFSCPPVKKQSTEETAINRLINAEQWFLAQLSEYTRRNARAERTRECCPESFLEQYAKAPKAYRLSDPRVKHVVACDYCLPRVLDLRTSRAAKRAPRIRIAALAAVGACLFVGLSIAFYWNKSRMATTQTAALGPTTLFVEHTFDLTDYGTYRGQSDDAPKPPLVLPAAVVHLHLILPRFSEPGRYTIFVATGRQIATAIVSAPGAGIGSGQQTKIDVSLDLRAVKPGNYFLLTLLEGQDDPYSYSLKIQ